MKKKIGICTVILLLAIGILGISMIIRNLIIIINLQNKVAIYEAKENIFYKVESNNAVVQTYIKGDKQKTIIQKPDKSVTIIQIIEPTQRRNYVIAGDSKQYTIYPKDENEHFQKVMNFVQTVNLPETIYNAMVSKIYTEKINGKDCYVMDSLKQTHAVYEEGTISYKMYIDKTTGLTLQIVETIQNENKNIIENKITYEHQFDVVTDEDMQDPDQSEFTLQESKM